ncbi:ABC transporter substrate-binding protein [Amycolatopsis sp. NPDC059027]|uniref:ABC transporter substrate-binding protein n=1 Tax=Amycolatopsis sp. NPDC059027 TaxID=3346709 RepID=UPI003671CAD5
MLTRFPLLGAMVMAAALLTGCTGGSTGATGPRAATDADVPLITWAASGPPRSLDIAHALDTRSELPIVAAFDALLTLDTEGRLQPGLAKSWSSPDPLTYVYQLRTDVKFWNGTPMTAEDVAYSLARQADPASGAESALYLPAVKSVDVTGPAEVTVKLSRPDALFQYVPAIVWFVQQKAYVQTAGKDLGTGQKPGMGTGAYQVTSFSTDGVHLRRNDGYWGKRPKVAEVDIKVIPDPDALRLAMQSGAVDGTFDFPVQRARQWEQTRGVATVFPQSPGSMYLSFDITKPPFDDVHVRRAIAAAVDRQGLLQPAFGGKATLAASMFSGVQLTSTLGREKADQLTKSVPWQVFDLAKARAELAQSAHPQGFTAEVPFTTSQPWAQLTLENLATNLAPLGIKLNLKALPDQQWVAQLYAHQNLGMQILRASGGTPYAGEMAGVLYGRKSAGPNGLNTANFFPDDVQRVLTQLTEPASTDQRAEQLGTLMRATAEQLPYVPLFEAKTGIAIADRLTFDPPISTDISLTGNWVSLIRAAAK